MTNMNQNSTAHFKRDHLSVCLFLLLFPLVILVIDFSLNQIPGNYTSLYYSPLWVEGKIINNGNYNTDTITDSSKYLSDYLYMSQVKSLSSLLWDNTSGAGTPFLARWESRCFSIFSIPFYFLPLWKSIYISIWLKMIVAGIGVYLLAISLGLLPSIGLFIAILFQVSGHLFFNPIHPITDVIVWFPLYLCFVNLVFYHSFRYWVLLCISIVFMSLGGSVETLAVIFAFTFLYFITVYFLARPENNAYYIPISFVILAWITAYGLISFQILPYIEWNNNRAIISSVSLIPNLIYKDLLGLFLPAGISSGHIHLTSIILLCSPGICCIFLLPLWLSARSLIHSEIRGKIESFFVVSLFLFVIFYLISCLNLQLPYFQNISLFHTGWFLILSMGCIIGMAIEAWNLFSPDECRQCVKKLLVFAILFWVALFILVLAGKLSDNPESTSFWKEFGSAWLFLFLIFLYLLFSLFYPSARNSGYIVTLILLLSVVVIYRPYRITTPLELLKVNEESINKLKQYGTRFAGPEVLQNSVFPIDGLNMMVISPEKCTERYSIFMKKALEDPKLWFRAGTSCFLFTSIKNSNPDNSFYKIRSELKLADMFSSGMAIFKSDKDNPRAFVIYNGKTTDNVNPDLLSSNLPHFVENAPIPETTSVTELSAVVEDISPTHVRIKVEKTKPGILVLTDTYYPGWSVSVDNVSKDIIPVNIAFRGVELSEGDHLIDFEYQCKGFWWGLTISIIAFILFLVIIRFSFRFSRQLI